MTTYRITIDPKGIGFYRDTLAAIFGECHRMLKDEGLLVFTFHHGAAEAWDALAEALRAANFVIRRIWPVHAEMDVGVPILGKESVKFDAILVCHKGEEAGEPIVDPGELARRIREVAHSMIEKLEGAFSLTEMDRASLYQAVAAMLYTQGRTECLPSSLTMN